MRLTWDWTGLVAETYQDPTLVCPAMQVSEPHSTLYQGR